MLFRADFVRQKHVPGSIETNHGSLSKIIGLGALVSFLIPISYVQQATAGVNYPLMKNASGKSKQNRKRQTIKLNSLIIDLDRYITRIKTRTSYCLPPPPPLLLFLPPPPPPPPLTHRPWTTTRMDWRRKRKRGGASKSLNCCWRVWKARNWPRRLGIWIVSEKRKLTIPAHIHPPSSLPQPIWLCPYRCRPSTTHSDLVVLGMVWLQIVVWLSLLLHILVDLLQYRYPSPTILPISSCPLLQVTRLHKLRRWIWAL